MLTDDILMESKNEEPTNTITESKSLEGEFKIEENEKSCPAMTEKGDEIQDSKDEKETSGKSNCLEVAIMLPPPSVLVPLMASSAASSGGQTLTANEKIDEEDVMSLQVLSARSSTPYTVQGVCCASANCEALEATNVTETSNSTCQWKDIENKENPEKIDRSEDVEKHGLLLNGVAHLEESKKYSRSDLMDIRSEMTIVRPECLEEARLQRLHFRKFENTPSNGSSVSRNRSYRNSNLSNDLMPSFYKRKAAIADGNNSNSNSIYDNFKYNDTNSYHHNHENGNNYRRIGSGRITSNREREMINWDYIPEEDPERNNLPDFFNTQSKPQRHQHNKKQELDDNANYVKRGNGESFRSLGGSRHSINSSGEERYNTTASSSNNTTNNNKSDEPEWFSCGPTSRLDTIELSGFNESDQQKIRMEMAKNKLDSNNNNRQDTSAGQQNKEKKQLAFQFDEFSSTNNGGNKSSGGGQKIPSSKFMPLFNAKKKDEDSMAVASVHSSNQSLNDFFKRNEMSQTCENRKEKLSPTEMPSVDEIEAKWRANLDGRTSDASFNNTSENFKKMLHQLNQQQQHQQQQLQHQFGRSISSSSPPPLMPNNNNNNNQQHQPMNLFNNENLSNFIKHRNIQQQLFQKQQQQAAFAQLQINAILSRPDTQMLLLSLARGEISKHGLVVQLANPNLTQSDREAISAALTFSTAGPYHQQMAINSNQQQLIANQLQNLALMHQQLNKSPVSRKNTNAGGVGGGGGGSGGAGNYQQHNGSGTPRTYTQEELQSHANFILHNAMLKKKLEEQNLGLQKMLHLQSTMMSNSNHNNICTPPRGSGVANDKMAGSKNFNQQQQAHHQINVQQQQQQQQQHNQRTRKTPNAAGSRNGHAIGRRRSTSSSSSNTVNSGSVTMNSMQRNHLQLRRQLEQRRNTIATATVGGAGTDDFVKISQRI